MAKQQKRNISSKNGDNNNSARTQRIVCLLSEDENKIVENYLKRYKISNKSNWMRETILSFIYKNLDEDYPTLFNEHDMRR